MPPTARCSHSPFGPPPPAPSSTSASIRRVRCTHRSSATRRKYYGTAGIENQYNQQLTLHTLPAQTLSQALGFEPLQSSIDNVTLTVDPHLQETAESALSEITGANKDAAVVAVDPSTGAVLADYSNPTFDPNVLASPDVTAEREAGYADFDAEGRRGQLRGRPTGDGRDVSTGVDLQGRDDDRRLQPRPRPVELHLPHCGLHPVAQLEPAPPQRRRRGMRR